MTEIIIAYSLASHVLNLHLSFYWCLGIYKLLNLLIDFITGECKAWEIYDQKAISITLFLCLLYFFLYYKLPVSEITIINEIGKYTYNNKQNSRIRGNMRSMRK